MVHRVRRSTLLNFVPFEGIQFETLLVLDGEASTGDPLVPVCAQRVWRSPKLQPAGEATPRWPSPTSSNKPWTMSIEHQSPNSCRLPELPSSQRVLWPRTFAAARTFLAHTCPVGTFPFRLSVVAECRDTGQPCPCLRSCCDWFVVKAADDQSIDSRLPALDFLYGSDISL
ncbi:hypothetical protein CLAIMM_01665 [Cladophialophora immunda]|nr:hypothetical protein CLAIMM_01665 [Cladophialophora immunda]